MKKKQKKYPKIWSLAVLKHQLKYGPVRECDGIWYPCRGIGPSSLTNRIKAVWLVWTGKADAVVWPGNQ